MRRTTPPVAGAGRRTDCPAGSKRAGSGGRPRRAGGGGGDGDCGPPSSLDALVSRGVPYSPSDDELDDDGTGGDGSRAQLVPALLLVIISVAYLRYDCKHYFYGYD